MVKSQNRVELQVILDENSMICWTQACCQYDDEQSSYKKQCTVWPYTWGLTNILTGMESGKDNITGEITDFKTICG